MPEGTDAVEDCPLDDLRLAADHLNQARECLSKYIYIVPSSPDQTSTSGAYSNDLIGLMFKIEAVVEHDLYPLLGRIVYETPREGKV